MNATVKAGTGNGELPISFHASRADHEKAVSRFRISAGAKPIGSATMAGNVVRFKADESAYGWLESQTSGFLNDLKANVVKLCRSVGHWSQYSISTDTDTGITVERL